MTTLCPLTDLDTDSCDHCRTPLPPPRPRGVRYSDPEKPEWIVASWPGLCGTCRKPFPAGTQVRLDIPRGWRAACCKAR